MHYHYDTPIHTVQVKNHIWLFNCCKAIKFLCNPVEQWLQMQSKQSPNNPQCSAPYPPTPWVQDNLRNIIKTHENQFNARLVKESEEVDIQYASTTGSYQSLRTKSTKFYVQCAIRLCMSIKAANGATWMEWEGRITKELKVAGLDI